MLSAKLCSSRSAIQKHDIRIISAFWQTLRGRLVSFSCRTISFRDFVKSTEGPEAEITRIALECDPNFDTAIAGALRLAAFFFARALIFGQR